MKLPNSSMSFWIKPGFLLLLCNQINSVFDGLSFSRLEDIHRLTETEKLLKHCNAMCSSPGERWQKTCNHPKMYQNRCRLGQTPLEELTKFYTLLVRMEMRGRWISFQSRFLGYATVVNLNLSKSFLFYLKCTKIAGCWGSAPAPARAIGGAYSAPQTP